MLRTIAIVLLLALSNSAASEPLGTAFQYQGRLDMGGVPFSGNANLWFLVYDADDVFVAQTPQMVVAVVDGLFSVELDFGPIFDGRALFMEIEVLTGSDPDWTALSPRIPILAAPYALHALDGAGGGGAGPWVEDAGDLTYGGGTVGVTNWSSPIAAGNGVFLEGGLPNHANVYAYDYDLGIAKDLLLNAPGGDVGIGVVAPSARLHVATDQPSPAIFATNNSNTWVTLEARNTAVGGTSIYATAPSNGRAIDGWSFGSGWAVTGSNQPAETYGILGTPSEGVAGISNNSSIPAGRFTNTAIGGIGIEVAGLASVKTLKITGGADLAERFSASEPASPGTVMAIDPRNPGSMTISDEAYCTRVAGVVSGAGGLDAGVILGEGGDEGGVAIALSGRVWVQCDTSNGPIEIGSLVTTSARRGHAMAAGRDGRAAGAILGKAMTSLAEGTGMVLVLVSLQ